MKVVYETDNGVRFDTQIACESFEKKHMLLNHIDRHCFETFDNNYGQCFILPENVQSYIMDNISEINAIIERMKK